jgi:hypothetical protein
VIGKELQRETAFIIGPPAAGKSTIGRAVASSMDVVFRTIDDWVPQVYQQRIPPQPMTDAQVDQSLSLLLTNTRRTNQIVEFAHHDYEELLRLDRYPVFSACKKVIVIAPLAVCVSRNEIRVSRVRTPYLERAWRSTHSLVNLFSTGHLPNAIVIDTSILSVEDAVETAMSFLTN